VSGRRAAQGIAVTIASATALTASFGMRASELDATARGAAVYAKYCAVCHGAGGAGDGRAAAVQTVRPADLTLSTRSAEYKQQIISRGGAALGRSSSMPAWSHELSPTDIRDLVSYVQTLSARRHE
jgi:mono/diheme cytochrome c family protein